MLRPRLFVLAAVLAWAACSNPAPPSILRPGLDGARLQGEDTAAQPHPLTDGTWRPVAWQGWSVDLDGAPESARREDGPDGAVALTLGPDSGAWIRWLAVEPGTPLELTADVTGGGLGGETQARLGLIELTDAPDATTWANLAAAAVGGNYGRPLRDLTPSEPLPLATWLRTGEATTHVLLFATLTNADGRGDAWVRFEAPRLAVGDQAGRLAAVLETEDPARPAAPFLVAMTERRARPVAAGEALAFDLDLTSEHLAAGASLELRLALVPRARDPRHPDVGATTKLTARLLQDGATFDLAAFDLPMAEAEDERWLELDADLARQVAAGLSAGPATLEVAASSALAPLDAPLGLVAAPRLVPPAPARPGPNVVVVSIDTLRADRMSLYGHERATTPRLDAFAADALVFESAWSNGAYTLPSHMSLFTGQVPSVHGVQGAGVRRDPERSPLLAEVLAERGWTTAAFTGGGFVNPEFGFGAGFERYGTLDPLVNRGSRKLRADLENVPGVDLRLLEENGMDVVEGWLEDHADESFFLFLHTYAAHQFDPWPRHARAFGLEGELADDTRSLELIYSTGEGATEEELEKLLLWYDATVLQADEGFGRLVDKLDALGLMDDTILVVTSDHGKALGEHGSIGHGHDLHEEMVHVPLVVYLPPAGASASAIERGAFAPGRSAAPASLVDVVPTILEALDLAPWQGMQGQSLLSLDPTTTRPVLAEIDNLAVKFALREGDAKTIWSPMDRDPYIPNEVEELSYDLGSDPLERAPLPPDPERIARVRQTFEALRAWAAELGSNVEAGLDDPSLRASLEALGYVEDVQRASE